MTPEEYAAIDKFLDAINDRQRVVLYERLRAAFLDAVVCCTCQNAITGEPFRVGSGMHHYSCAIMKARPI